jgi:hypothetical protein
MGLVPSPVVAAALASALLFLAGGCQDGPSEPVGPVSVANVQVSLQSAPLRGLEVPAGVVAFGGTGGARTLIEGVGAFAVALGLPASPVPFAQVSEAARLGLRLKDGGAIDWTRPLRGVAVTIGEADVTGGGRTGYALAFAITDRDAFVAALPADRSEREGGNAFAWDRLPGTPTRLYLNFLHDRAIISTHPGLFGRYGEFVERVVDAQVAAGLEVHLPVAALRGPAAEAPDAARARVRGVFMDLARGLGLDERVVAAGLEVLSPWMTETESWSLRFEARGEGVRASTTWTPRPGSDLSRAMVALRPDGGPTLTARLPANADVVLWARLGPQALASHASAFGQGLASAFGAVLSALDGPPASSLIAAAMTLAGRLHGPSGAPPAGLSSAITALVRASSGEAALGIVPAAEGATAVGLYGVSNSTAAQAAQRSLVEAAAAAPGARGGWQVEALPRAFEVDGVPGSTLTLRPGAPGTSKGVTALAAELGHWSIASGATLGALASGPQGRAAVEGLLGASVARGFAETPAARAAFEAAGPGAVFLFQAAPLQAVARPHLGGESPFAGLRAKLQSTSAVEVSRVSLWAAVEAGRLTAAVDLPAAALRPLVDALGVGAIPPR